MDKTQLQDLRDQMAADPAHSNDLMLFDRIISRVAARKASLARREGRAAEEKNRQARELERQTRKAKIEQLEKEAASQLEQRKQADAALAAAKAEHESVVAALTGKLKEQETNRSQLQQQIADTIERHGRAMKEKEAEVNDLKKDNVRVRAQLATQTTKNERLASELQATRVQMAKQLASDAKPAAAAPAGPSVLKDTVVVKGGPADLDEENTDPDATEGEEGSE